MNQGDYNESLKYEYRTNDAGINFHAGNDVYSHSSGCTILGTKSLALILLI